MMQGAGLGLISNCAGVFFSPVCNDLGFEMGKFTLFKTLSTVSQALALPYVAKLFKKNLKKLKDAFEDEIQNAGRSFQNFDKNLIDRD